jgi:hypothetical protein
VRTGEIDTTSDTTEGATRRNCGQLPAKKSAYLCRVCNIWQRPETGIGGLWLRRARVRAPSVTPRLQYRYEARRSDQAFLTLCRRHRLRGSVNRRVSQVSRRDRKAVESLRELPSMKSCQPIDGSSKQGSQRAAIGANFELGRHVGKGT